MTKNGQRISPLRAAKEIYVAFGEQAECMGIDEGLDFIGISDATKKEQIDTIGMIVKVCRRVRTYLGL